MKKTKKQIKEELKREKEELKRIGQEKNLARLEELSKIIWEENPHLRLENKINAPD